MSKELVRVGIIGAGGNTVSRHIPGLQAIQGVEVLNVCNRSAESSQRVADQFGIPKIHQNWTELIADEETNAIVIGTWPYLHCRATLAALEKNKHVLCEARMAMNAREAEAMRDAAGKKPHLIAQLVPSPFTLGVDKTVQRLIASGYLGQLRALEVRDYQTFSNGDDTMHWRHDFDLSGFNTMSLGIWYEALMRWVGEAKRVLAMGRTFTKMRKDQKGTMRSVHIPEHLDVIADMACGAQLHLQISTVARFCGPPRALIFGSKGTLLFSEGGLSGGQQEDTELRKITIPPEERGGWRVEEEFVNAIRGQETVTHTTFDEGVKYMEFTEAVRRSVEKRECVSLPL